MDIGKSNLNKLRWRCCLKSAKKNYDVLNRIILDVMHKRSILTIS